MKATCRFSPALKAMACSLFLMLAVVGNCQTFTVLHTFTGGADGSDPYARLVLDRAGNLYGTASMGGAGYGVVFKLTNRNDAWTLSPIYTFQGGNDGVTPLGLTIAPDGSLYGVTAHGGGQGCSDYGPGCGTVFNLKPSPVACASALCSWTESVLYRFTGSADGGVPGQRADNALTLDAGGNIYGTTFIGGAFSGGTVYQLSRSGGNWSQQVIYDLGQADQNNQGYRFFGPVAGVVFGPDGGLYGTAPTGDDQNGTCDGRCGAVFEVQRSGSSWTGVPVTEFYPQGVADQPLAGLVFDPAGNFYGSTMWNEVVFENSRQNIIYQLQASPFCGPWDAMIFDRTGNLYGTTTCPGAVFKLSDSNGVWSYTSLHTFTGGSDGSAPVSGLVMDADGNIYGTTATGGGSGCGGIGCGVVFKITP